MLCGRYEGFDERILEHFASEQISIGRYVLAGGELAAMVVCDTVLRKLPGALGHEESAIEESFSPALEGRPEYPHYTRPAEYRGWRVPEVLLSGPSRAHRTVAAAAQSGTGGTECAGRGRRARACERLDRRCRRMSPWSVRRVRPAVRYHC